MANTYNQEQLRDAEAFAQIIAKTPKEERNVLTMVTNAFAAGIEAGRQMAQQQKVEA